jgi:hypothetical protein
MKLTAQLLIVAAGFVASITSLLAADITTITVHVDKPGAKINPAMWGVFFEDINFGADGGLYAELVKNQSFEFPDPMMGWSRPVTKSGKAEIRKDAPFNAASPHYLRFRSEGDPGTRVSNEGFAASA